MANWHYPGGKTVAAITSWDGGPQTDRLMLRMLDQYGWMGTFYLRPDKIGTEGYADGEMVRKIAASGHELGLFGLGNGTPKAPAPAEITARLHEEKSHLESLVAQPVSSLAYPYGFDPRTVGVAEAIAAAGFASARTTTNASANTASEIVSGNTLRLPVTARYSASLDDVRDKWDAMEASGEGVFHLWGESREMGEDPHDWLDFECILGFFGGMTEVWYCTVGEFIAHLQKMNHPLR